MAFVFIVSTAAALTLFIFLARYARNPAILRAEVNQRFAPAPNPQQPRITPKRFGELVLELLPQMGLIVQDVEPLPRAGALRIRASAPGALRRAPHIIYAEPGTPADRIGPEILLGLADDARHVERAVGMLISPCHIDHSVTAGLDVELELVDGLGFERLVAQHLPHHADEVRAYQLTGTVPASTVSATLDDDDDREAA